MYCAHFRQHVYVTPKHYKRYLSFLNGYKNLYRMKLVEELMFANKIGFSAGSIAPNWVDVFLKGSANLDINDVKTNVGHNYECFDNVECYDSYERIDSYECFVSYECYNNFEHYRPATGTSTAGPTTSSR